MIQRNRFYDATLDLYATELTADPDAAEDSTVNTFLLIIKGSGRGAAYPRLMSLAGAGFYLDRESLARMALKYRVSAPGCPLIRFSTPPHLAGPPSDDYGLARARQEDNPLFRMSRLDYVGARIWLHEQCGEI